MKDYQSLFGVTPEQVRANQVAAQQRMFAQAQTPQMLSGMAIGSVLGRLLGGKSDALKDAEARQAFKDKVDWNDAESLRLLATNAPTPEIGLGLTNRAKTIEAEKLALQQAAEDRARMIQGENLDQLQTGLGIKKTQTELDKMNQPKPLTYEQALKISEAYAATDPAERLDTLQELTGEGARNFEKDLEELTPFLTTQSAILMQADPTLSADRAFAQAAANYIELFKRGSEPAKTTSTGEDAYADLAPVPADREVVVDGEAQMLRPVEAFQTRADINKRRTKINEVSKAIGKIDNQLANFEKAMMRSRRGATPENQSKVAELKTRRDKLAQQLKLFNEGYIVPTEE